MGRCPLILNLTRIWESPEDVACRARAEPEFLSVLASALRRSALAHMIATKAESGGREGRSSVRVPSTGPPHVCCREMPRGFSVIRAFSWPSADVPSKVLS
ncbi:unnamed protein product [Prorocentrum cordatum]|uniref:Uncharacterized protein n=1 Tax=Prorocentrum cordatum TaxID=2364126 RepID=A0ABN9XJY4_9DINO|nr:unnamed protein product [Polarella glacialis]